MTSSRQSRTVGPNTRGPGVVGVAVVMLLAMVPTSTSVAGADAGIGAPVVVAQHDAWSVGSRAGVLSTGVLVVAGNSDNLVARDATTGALTWTTGAALPIAISARANLVLAINATGLWAHDLGTGNIKWKSPVFGQNAIFSLDGTLVAVQASYPDVAILSSATGAIVRNVGPGYLRASWDGSTGAIIGSSVILLAAESYIQGPASAQYQSPRIRSFDVASGNLLWETTLSQPWPGPQNRVGVTWLTPNPDGTLIYAIGQADPAPMRISGGQFLGMHISAIGPRTGVVVWVWNFLYPLQPTRFDSCCDDGTIIRQATTDPTGSTLFLTGEAWTGFPSDGLGAPGRQYDAITSSLDAHSGTPKWLQIETTPWSERGMSIATDSTGAILFLAGDEPVSPTVTREVYDARDAVSGTLLSRVDDHDGFGGFVGPAGPGALFFSEGRYGVRVFDINGSDT